MAVHWASLFGFTVDPWELVLRGTVMYWFLFLLFRFVLRRDVGSLGLADVLLLVVISDASQNALAGGYNSIAEGCLLVATIAAWNLALDWGGYRFAWLRGFLEPPKLMLVRHGRVLGANLRREFMTIEELRSKLRQHGIEHLSEVKLAFMEPDGEISAIRFAQPRAEVADEP